MAVSNPPSSCSSPSVLAVHLDDGASWQAGDPVWSQVATPIAQTFRGAPVASRTFRDPAHPTMYIGQRGSGECLGGEGNVYRLDPVTGDEAIDMPPVNESPAIDPEPLFPVRGDDPIDHVSFSAPMVNPRSGHIFFGGAAAGEPIFKVDPRHPQRSNDADSLLDYSRVGWFDFAPQDGWRTNASFSTDAMMVYIGSALGIVYGLDADEPCGLVRRCYDTKTGKGADCAAHADSNEFLCCKALKDSSAVGKEFRRTAPRCETCWHEDGTLIDCKDANLVTPDQDTLTEEGNGFVIDFATFEAELRAADTFETLVVENPTTNSYKISFGLNLEADGSPVFHSSQRRGEAMNETTGVVSSAFFCPSPWPCAQSVWSFPVEMKPGTNEMRFAFFDEFGNESMTRLKMTGVPALP